MGPKRGLFLAQRGFNVYSLNKLNQSLQPPRSEAWGYLGDRQNEKKRDRHRESLAWPQGV